jgi:hypothetical protein
MVGLTRLVNADVTLQVVRDGRVVTSGRGGTTDVTGVLAQADIG